MIRLAIHGAAGRMGARLGALAREDPRFEVVAEIDLPAADLAGVELDAIVDFSSDEGARNASELALKHSAALLVGTTALSRQTLQSLDVAARSVPVLVAANTSVGIAVLTDLAVRAARLLGPGYDLSLIESHHAQKRDAPSGTALRLAESLRRVEGVTLEPGQIHAVRGGDVVGEHTIEFAGPGERIRLAHIATNRDLFVRGALRAVAWLAGRPPGHYTIGQVVGIGEKVPGTSSTHPVPDT